MTELGLPVVSERTSSNSDAIGRRLTVGLGEYAGFLPAICFFGAFLGAPMALIVAYSFWNVVDYNVVHAWTLDNYRYFLSATTYLGTAWATLWMSALTTALTLVLAFPFAYWLARHVPNRWRKPLLVLVILPFWTSYLLRIFAWVSILGDKGAINRLLQTIGLAHGAVSLFLYNRTGVVLVLVYLYFPFALLTLYVSLDRFDWSLLKAALDLGASPRRVISRVVVPQIRSGIATASIFVFIPVIGEYLTPQLVGGTRGIMIGNTITNFFQDAQYTRGAAVALLVALVIVVLLVFFRNSLEVESGSGRASDTEIVSRGGRLTRTALAGYALLSYAFLFAPIGLLVAFAFNANRFGTFPITGWTTSWFGQVVHDFEIKQALGASLRVAAEVTAVSVIVGTAAAFPLVRAKLRYRHAVRILFTLPMMIPGLLIGVGLLVFLNNTFHLALSSQTAVVGQAVYTTPFVILLVATALATFDPMLERGASDLGANGYQRIRYIVLPLILPAIFTAALLVFTLSLDEYVITSFLIGTDTTLPIYIYSQVKYGITPEVNALATILLAASLLLIAMAVLAPIAVGRIRGRRAKPALRAGVA